MINPFEYLCTHDYRNPRGVMEFISEDELEDYPDSKSENKNCACDNCFYGRTKLALRILELEENLKHEKS